MHGARRLRRRGGGLTVAAVALGLLLVPALPAVAEGAPATVDVLKVVDGAYVVETVAVPAHDAAATADEIEKAPDVVAASPSVTYQVTADDPYWDPQDPQAESHVRDVWPRTRGEGQIVAVLDTTAALDHPDLSGATVPGIDIVGGTGSPWHGTGVAGIIAARADNGIGSAGMAPLSRVMPVRVCNDGGCPSDSIARGILWAADHGADVINMSLAGPGYSDVTAAAVDYALAKNISVIASAGNDGQNSNAVMYPAALAGVIGVSSTDPAGVPSTWAEHGWQVDLSTVGDSVLLTQPGGAYAYASGTSFSGPAVAGAVALVRASHPGITTTGVQAALQAGAESSNWDRGYGAGRLDVPTALDAADRTTGVLTVNPGAHALDVAWDAVPGATQYSVRVDGTVRTTVAGTSAQLTGLTDGTQYAVDVQPNNGSRSRPVLATAGVGAPGTPTLTSGSLRGTSTSAVLDLQASITGTPAPSYAVLRDGVSIGTLSLALTSTPTTFSIAIGAMPTVETRWQLRGVDDLGRTSPASDSVTTGSGRPAPPDGVTGLTGHLDGNRTLLTWDDLGTAFTYRVSVGGSVVASPRTAGAVLPAPALGEASTYEVVAVDAWGQSGPAVTTQVAGDVNPAAVAPSQVTGLSVTPADRRVTVRWSTPATDGGARVTGFTVQTYRGGTTVATTPAPAGTTSVVVLGLNNGTAYTFTVTATNAAGTGTESAQTSPVTPAPVPASTDLSIVHRLGSGMNLWQLSMLEPGSAAPHLVTSLNYGGFSYDGSVSLSGDFGAVTPSDDGSPDEVIWHAQPNGGVLVWGVGGGADPTPKLWQDLRTGGWSWAQSRPMVGDVTGDGIDDLVVRHASGAGGVNLWVLPGNGHSVGAPELWGSTTGSLDQRAELADVDGDGRADLILARPVSGSSGLVYDVLRSSGSAFGARENAFTGAVAGGWSPSSRLVVGDVTGDGRPDLVTLHSQVGNPGLLVWVHENCSTGTTVCFRAPKIWQDLRTGGWSYAASRQYLADTDGDGRADLITLHAQQGNPGLLVWRAHSDGTKLLAPVVAADLRAGGWSYQNSRAAFG